MTGCAVLGLSGTVDVMRVSTTGLELIKRFEGFRASAVAVPGGGWVVGYGHTTGARQGVTLSRADASAVLRNYDLPPVEKLVEDAVFTPLAQGAFDALVSFAFNVGEATFRDSDVLARVNAGDMLGAADALATWRKARVNGRVITVDALARRRAAEVSLLLDLQHGAPGAPSALVKPVADLPASAGSAAEPAAQAVDPAARSDETAPEAAARAVGERLTAILKQPPTEAPEDEKPESDPEHVPNAEEITQAVSALAGIKPVEASETARPADIDLPLVDDESASPEQPDIDDLAVPPLPEAPLEPDLSNESPRDLSWAPFAIVATLGGALAGWGLADALGAPSNGVPESRGVLLAFVGVTVAVVMGYYLARLGLQRRGR